MYKENKRGLALQGKSRGDSRRAHSSVVEHRTAVPVVIGSNPIVPFFSHNNFSDKKKIGRTGKEVVCSRWLRS